MSYALTCGTDVAVGVLDMSDASTALVVMFVCPGWLAHPAV